MTRFLPLFPLGLIAFPGEALNLHIFEPRYRQLIHECDTEKKTFGLSPSINKRLSGYGTEIELLKIAKTYEDGRMDIKTKGIGIFKIEKFYRTAPDKLYAAADITDIAFTTVPDTLTNISILERIKELYSVLGIEKKLPEDPATFSTYQLAHHVGFSVEQELEFLQTPEERERQLMMLDHLEKLIPIVQQTEQLRERVQMNGHFKNIIPPDFKEGDFSL